MAAKKSTTQVRPTRNPAPSRKAEGRKRSPASALKSAFVLPEAIEDAIEEERSRLMRAETILQCVLVAMNDNDGFDDGDCDVDGPHYPTMIELARDLLNLSIRRLDSVNLNQVREVESDEDDDSLDSGFVKYKVKEPYVPYLCHAILTIN